MSDSGNILDNAEVDFLIDGAGGEEPPPEPGQAQDEQAVTMRGDLDQINLSDIFQTLALTKMEGVLRVRNPLEQRQVYCNDGYVRILVPARIATRRLGQRLVKAGLLAPEQLRSALLKQRREPMPLGTLLVAEGLVVQDQVDGVAGMQVAEDLFALFTWRHGTFEFYKGTVSDPELQQRFETCPEFEVSSLLLEVARRSDEWESILAALSSLDEVPARIADVPADRELGEIERGLLFGADGRLTYRQLADQTTHGLFEVARVARDLVRAGCLANVGDDELIATAEVHAESEHPKQALMLLQTLRDRSGERSLATLNRMVAVLDKAGERKLAGTMLLEIAQQQTNPEVALPLARRARELAPTDPGTISFLRTTLLVHAPADSSELDRCTLDLLDALLAIDKADTAIEIIDEVRQAGSASTPILVREARARQKVRDVPGATKVLFELGELYRAQHDKKHAIEAYETILRLDRSRKDVQKLVRQMRQTRTDRIVRATAAGVAACLLGAMGFVFWQQSRLDDAVHSAAVEIGELLRSGDRVAARERLEHWAEVIDEPEHVEDLRHQVEYAEASELTRVKKLERKRMHERLTQAAETLRAGDLRGALLIYGESWRKPDFRDEVAEVTATRIDAELVKIEQVAKTMTGRLPPEPNTLLDRAELTAKYADLQAMCPPALLRVVDDLRALHGSGALPPFLSEPCRNQVVAVLGRTQEVFDRANDLSQAYSSALQRNETQRRLDPLFKRARHLEDNHDFAGALDLYRQLDTAEASDGAMRAHFRDRVTRYQKICDLMAAVAKATAAGDFPAAQQHYRTLREAFAEVPFDRLVRLPLLVESLPSGAAVQCNGAEVGHTPCTLAFLPADENRLAISLTGFLPEAKTVTGDQVGRLQLHLLLEPRFVRKQDNMIEAAPALDDRGRIFLVDRGGVVTALDHSDGHEVWKFPTGDLSGLLSPPFVHGDHVVVASLDGELRALDRASGKQAWTMPDMPTEVGPVLVDRFLAIATTQKRLALVDLAARSTVASTDLPETPRASLLARGPTIFWCGDGAVGAHTVPSLARLWHRPLPDFGEKSLVLTKDTLLVADDRGHLAALDLQDGHTLWQRSIEAESLGAPIVADEEILVGSPQRILRFAAADGRDRSAIAAGDEELAGPPRRVGLRLLAPTRGGFLQVFDAGGHALYRLEGKRGAQVLAADGIVLIVLPDRRVHFFGVLR